MQLNHTLPNRYVHGKCEVLLKAGLAWEMRQQNSKSWKKSQDRKQFVNLQIQAGNLR